LSTLPTDVSGNSATKVTFSGIAIFDRTPRSTNEATCRRMSSWQTLPILIEFEDDQSQRTFAPLDVLDRDDRGAPDAGLLPMMMLAERLPT
jgi:hypothetical protein